jgi:acyl carrier protein
MTTLDLRTAVAGALHRVAPEADLDQVAPDTDLREAFELDSMDFLTFIEELYSRTGIDVPERDYPLVTTLERCVSYLASRSGPAPTR